MAIVRTAANVRPVNPWPGDVVADVALHATITAGEVVYHDGTGWAQGALAEGAEGKLLGVALEGGASGEYKSVLLRGRLTGWTGFGDGTQLYTAASGEVSDSASPQYSIPVGYSINDTDWYFVGAMRAAEAS
jgi:hypothetical protein